MVGDAIEPGDIGFSTGKGLLGRLISVGTESVYSHTWVYHSRNEDGSWNTVEAQPILNRAEDGVRWRVRTEPPSKILRLWRNEEERERLLAESERLAEAEFRYGWSEVLRMALNVLGITVQRSGEPDAVICSQHVALALFAARQDMADRFGMAAYDVWPGRLAETGERIARDDRSRELVGSAR